MPKSGKQLATELFTQDGDSVVVVTQASLLACFEYAKRRPELSDRTNSNELAKHIRENAAHYGDTVSKSHIYRIKDGSGPVGTDVLQIIAKAYGLEAWQMLVEGMEPQNPPSVLVSAGQRRLFKELGESYKEIAKPEAKNAEKSTAGSADPRGHTARATRRPRDAGRAAASGKAGAKGRSKAKA